MRVTVTTLLTFFILAGVAGAAITDPLQASRSVSLLQSSSTNVSMRCEISDIHVESIEAEGAMRSVVTLPGEATTYYPGMPVLPSVSRFVVVSPNSNLELTVDPSEPRRVRAEFPPLLLKGEDGESVAIDVRDGIFPSVVAEMDPPFIIRGVRMVKVTTYPVRYDLSTNEFLYYDNVVTEVRSIAGEADNPALYPDRKGRSQEFLSFISEFAINGEQVGRDDPEFDGAPRYVGHYLVATHASCLQYIIPFIEWRRKAGYKVDILSLSDGDARSAGTVQTQIQNRYNAYLQNNQDPFEYLLLVGDRTAYENAPAAGWVLDSPVGTSTWGNPAHGEYLYACLEGNDTRPDIAWGRWPAGSQAPLELAVGRTLMYEATPDMEHDDWFTRGAVYSQHWGNSNESAWHVSIPTTVRWGVSVLNNLGFDDVRFYENFEWDRIAEALSPFLRRQFNERTNIMIGRAEIYWWTSRGGGHSFDNDINENTVFPVNVSCSGHGEWGAEVMFRTGSGDNLKGYVTTTNGWGGAPTEPWNYYWLQMVNGILQKDLSTGWSFNRALNMIEKHFPRGYQYNGQDGFTITRTDLNHFGDPGLLPWLGKPRVVEMAHTSTIASNTRLVEVIVHLPDSEEPVPGATVTMYAPGSIPVGNPAQYAGYNQILSKVGITNAEGLVTFVLTGDERFVNNTHVYLTTTGRDIKPEFARITVAAPEASIDLGEWDLEEIQGNGDEFVNPGESFTLGFLAKNLSADGSLANVTGEIVSHSPYIEVEAHNPVNFGEINAGDDAEGDSRIAFTVSPVCPDGVVRPITRPRLEVIFRTDDQEFKSALLLEPRAPHLEFRRMFVGNNQGDIIPDSIAHIDIEIANIGSVTSPEDMVAELHTLGMGVSVIEAAATYPAIVSGRTGRLAGGARFDISGNKVVVPGSKTRMMLVLRSNEGILDTTYFFIQVMQPRNNAPIGPDPYGYICFDDTDTSWDIAPEYEWVEINPGVENNDFDGTRINFDGQSQDNIGEALVIDLGFETQFYGDLFGQVTVCTNGFIGLGSQPLIVNYQRWPMDEAMGGAAGSLAPFWNDLRLGQNSGIYYFYDADDSRGIITYHRMRFATGNDEVTFQVILYDHDVWITETGDQNILFQYKTITNPENLRANDQAWLNATPYASVGISSPDGKAGINYTWNNLYPTGAATLAARRAIFFTTSPRFKSGILYGFVTEAGTGRPLEGAMVFTKHGFVAITDENGYWRIAEALADVPFDITARMQGYNDSTHAELEVVEHDSLEINFDILHPEFTITHDRLGTALLEGQTYDMNFSLTNTGNGPMDWNAEKRLIGDANANPWELRRSYPISEITEDERLEGIVFADNRFFISGANDNEDNLIYILDREGALLDSFYQVGSTRYGYKDMDWDGNYIWAAGQDSIFAFTVAGEIAYQWVDPIRNPNAYVACNREEGIIYLSGTTSDIYRFDVEGNRLDGDISHQDLRQYGMTYWADDPDGYCLYIVNRPITNNNYSQITKMNIETGDTMTVAVIAQHESSTGQMSAFMTNEFDVYSWVFMSVQNVAGNGGGDRLEIHQVDARKDWMELDVWSGRLETGEVQDFVLTLNATGLPDTLFVGEILFRHNADDGEMRLGIELSVGSEPPSVFSLAYPENGDTLTALPLHGDTLRLPGIEFRWNPSIDPNPFDQVTYEFVIGVGERLVSFFVADTALALNPDTLDLPIWFDQQIWWRVNAISGGSPTACAEQFTLNILANEIDQITRPIPAEFGLGPVYPNPFNSRTSIRFGMDRAAPATLRLYDLQGRLVANLFDGDAEAGYHRVAYDGVSAANGIYWLRLESQGRTRTMKVALIK